MLLAALLIALSAPVSAAPANIESRSVLGLSPLGAFGFTLRNVGRFALVYERALTERHGLYAEGSFVHVHGDPTHLWTYGGQAGWRLHLSAFEEGAFVGAGLGYQMGSGHSTTGSIKHEIELSQLSADAHLGYRWALGENLALTGRLGTGYGPWSVSARDVAPGAAEAEDASRRALGTTPFDLDTELSLGIRL